MTKAGFSSSLQKTQVQPRAQNHLPRTIWIIYQGSWAGVTFPPQPLQTVLRSQSLNTPFPAPAYLCCRTQADGMHWGESTMGSALAVVALDPSCLDAALLTFSVSSHTFPNQHLVAKFKALGGLTYLRSILPPLKSQVKLSEDIFHSGKVLSLELSVTHWRNVHPQKK